MNTADISVLSDELVVTLNPLRRGTNRARAWCARVAGMALPWNTSGADVEPRRRVRPGSAPARWPFPPAPAEAGAPAGPAVAAPMPAPAAPVEAAVAAAPAARERSLGNATVEPVTAQVTMKAMVIDVVMVLAWGAIIPGLMWLGAAAGF
ncbi:hypothetical protein DXK93_19265 [Achromobacter sp. K91]|uniref:Uncharacterized protein n=1 Tax=Achromobacter aegrifaciens TaxID=1287736 RepID=A0AAD2IVX9_ACHAE|nr:MULTISPECIES: hypothetical protein [Achromobacter]MDQ1763069.1 hypothetical protein [Achromobacter aegrifaciens]MDR7944275.1 hypothetical protein [Achromobacter aegrifaciens]RIJ01784.1 hypothetical protein DXK93_19265 [Achromobacter sp. K91]CAB3883901.1 hypothetical protein LMG26854_04621 [Achromobacter aegrifaciens]CUI48268.1 Uncharacterised protein [Achromobacter aegrifaciens]